MKKEDSICLFNPILASASPAPLEVVHTRHYQLLGERVQVPQRLRIHIHVQLCVELHRFVDGVCVVLYGYLPPALALQYGPYGREVLLLGRLEDLFSGLLFRDVTASHCDTLVCVLSEGSTIGRRRGAERYDAI